MKQLQHLNLSYTNISGTVPNQLGNLSSLHTLDLGIRYWDGNDQHLKVDDLMWASNLSSLEYLDLSGVDLSGTKDVIKVLSTLPCMKELRLSGSGLDNTNLPHTCLSNSTLLLASVQHLDLSHNSFEGEFPCFLRNITSLSYLDLSDNLYNSKISGNKISGPLPASLGNLSALRELYLSRNQLSGDIPISIGQQSNLERFYISNNSLEGTLSEAHFANLSKLEILSVEYNKLGFRVGHDWEPPFQLSYLEMGHNKIGGQFPQWLQTQKALEEFDLSNCGITGKLPKWLNSTSLDYLSLARNFISGSIPDSLCEMKALRNLDLSGNQLSGILPDCWGNFESLDVARLSSNRLSGAIPNSIGGAFSLRWLHLDNSLTGQIPSTLRNCTKLAVLDVGDNKLSGILPEWIGDQLLHLVVLRLRNNDFYGVIPSTYCQPSQLQVMDLAYNNLTGNIPRCFGNFTGMVVGANHSVIDGEFYAGWFYESLNEVMKGVMREFTTTTKYVINLDLSCNRLAGEIPSELTNLTGLIGLNLSHNHLGGKIPRNVGDMKSLESLDLSSNNLSGTIPVPWVSAHLINAVFRHLSSRSALSVSA